MGIYGYIHFLIEAFLFVGLLILWFRWNRPAKEDPRLSRGLQLLQSKISILEDLSDRTDAQVKQMCKLLERKGAQVQEAILHAKDVISQIEQSIHESLEVADIFQDKIPHAEIIERESSKKYIEAARLAHQGFSPSEIAQKIDLDIAEIEFIAKVNKDRLMFAEDELPNWAKERQKLESSKAIQKNENEKQYNDDFGFDFEKAFANPDVSMDHLQELGKKFREACDDAKAADEQSLEKAEKLKKGFNGAIQSVLQPIEEVKTAIKNELNKNSQYDFSADDLDWEIEEEDEISSAVDRAMSRIESDQQQTDREQENFDSAFYAQSQKVTQAEQVVENKENAKLNLAHSTVRESAHGRVTVVSREDDLKKNSVLFNKNIDTKTTKTDVPTARQEKPNLLEQVRLRAKERIQSGALKTKVKSADALPSLKQLDFPIISKDKDMPYL